jgi:hypothetical protein
VPRDPDALEVTPRSSPAEVWRGAKRYENPDGSFSEEFGGSFHYWDGTTWRDKRALFVAGTGADEWLSVESDAVMKTYRTGTGGNRRWWVEFRERVNGQAESTWPGIRFQLQFQPTPSTNRLDFSDGSGGIWSYYHVRRGGKMLGPATASSLGARTYTFAYELLGGAPPLSLEPDGSLHCPAVFYMPRPRLEVSYLVKEAIGLRHLLGGLCHDQLCGQVFRFMAR